MSDPVIIINATPVPTPVLVVDPSTVIATPASPLFSPPALNPVLDIAPFHDIHALWLNTLPLWAIVGAIVGIYFLWYNISWMRKCGALSPCFGYKDCLMAGSLEAQQTIVFTKSRKWFIRLLTYHSEGILYFKELLKTDMWHVGSSSGVGTLGGMSAVITKDNFDEVVDPIADIALCNVCAKFNHGDFGDSRNRARATKEFASMPFALPDGQVGTLKQAAEAGCLPNAITCYDDFVTLRPILETIWPDGVDIPCYVKYDPYESDKYVPKQRSAALNGGIMLQDARDYAENAMPEPSFWDKNGFAMIMILGGLLIAGISFVATR